jgi:serine/threonine protein kinase
MIGKEILNYQIESLIGEGGMGTVYMGVNKNIGQKVAIKSLASQFVHHSEIVERFRKEASMLAKLDHPNIVKLLNFYEGDNGLYLIMEYVEGNTLDEYIENISGPISEQKTIDIFSKILDAFEFAHNQGIVHRDIKPSNIIITNSQEVKVFDFGIAKIIDEPESQKLTKTGAKMGTAAYMSPEQVRQGRVDKLSDIYTLGVVLHQMLTGKSPYGFDELSEFDISAKIVYELLPRANSIYPHVSKRMQDIIDKATIKEPSARFSSCNEFKQTLLGNNNGVLNVSDTLIMDIDNQQNEKISANHHQVVYLLKHNILNAEKLDVALAYFNLIEGKGQLNRAHKSLQKAVLLFDGNILSLEEFNIEKEEIRIGLDQVLQDVKLLFSSAEMEMFEYLNRLINKAGESFFGKLCNDLTTFLEINFSSRELSIDYIDNYNRYFNKDLLQQLMNISSKYNRIKAYLEVFIEQGIVEPEYPHNRIL